MFNLREQLAEHRNMFFFYVNKGNKYESIKLYEK